MGHRFAGAAAEQEKQDRAQDEADRKVAAERQVFLKAKRILGEAFIGALQRIWGDYHAGRAQTVAERSIALYVEAELIPVIEKRTNTESTTLVSMLAASIITAQPAPSAKPVGTFADKIVADMRSGRAIVIPQEKTRIGPEDVS